MNNYNGYRELNLVGFTDRGEYDPDAEYIKNDLTHYRGSIYKCTVDGTVGVTPTTRSNWDVFMSRLDGVKLVEKKITENGVYDPAEEGADGFTKLVVMISNIIPRARHTAKMASALYVAHPKIKPILLKHWAKVDVGGFYHVGN